MTTQLNQAAVAADARNRAWRTFVQNLLVDVVSAVALAVLPAMSGSDFAWSAGYWGTVATLAAKTAVLTVVSYVGRKVVPPAV
jgi:F0F1-type ATP synthase assembly protein I